MIFRAVEETEALMPSQGDDTYTYDLSLTQSHNQPGHYHDLSHTNIPGTIFSEEGIPLEVRMCIY